MTTRAFLTAEWRWLAMVNFAVDPEMLAPYVPAGTELDSWNGTTFVSLVGFLFRDTRVLGLAVPWHREFEEVNLRFYVRRAAAGGTVRRAVVFIREIVPRAAIATIARLMYNEPYVTLPMRHAIYLRSRGLVPGSVTYAWRQRRGWSHLRVLGAGDAHELRPDSEEEFITEHYWGYTRQRDGSTFEYEVEHPRWRIWPVSSAEVVGDLTGLYGSAFARVLAGVPTSAFLAEGSAVTVRAPVRLPRAARDSATGDAVERA